MDRKTGVLICIPTLAGGGAERQVRLLAPLLVRRGIALSLFSRLARADLEALTVAGVACFPISAPGNHHPALPAQMIGALARSRPRIVHSWLTQMDILGGTLALATGRRWILSERASKGAYSPRAKDRLRARLGRHADAVVANSRAGAEGWHGHPRRMVVANGIDFDAIARAPPRPRGEDRRLAGRTIVISVARLDPQKRIDRLLHATARLRLRCPEILLVLLGRGSEEAALKALARRLEIQDHVLFAGFRADPWSWMKTASVFVSTSLHEGQPNSVLEAAAIGAPLILSDIRAHRDCVGEDGAVFVDGADAEAIAAAIQSLIERPELARRRAAAAHAAVRGLSADRAADLYCQLYRRIAAGKG
jgi:glycosyltransferase involved in cell wall biosynthesis